MLLSWMLILTLMGIFKTWYPGLSGLRCVNAGWPGKTVVQVAL